MRIPSVTHGAQHRWLRVAAAGVVAVLTLTAGSCDGRAGIVSGEGTVSSSAGTVDVQCIDRSLAKIVGFQPAAGYTGRLIVEGPSGQASLMFENPDANDFRVGVHCVDSEPKVEEFEVEDTALSD